MRKLALQRKQSSSEPTVMFEEFFYERWAGLAAHLHW